jgi:hypothetical protein
VLIATSLGALAAAFFLATGPFRSWFGFEALPAGLITAIVLITFSYLVVAEAAKRFALARWRSGASVIRRGRSGDGPVR